MELLVNDYHPDFIILSETCVTSEIDDSEIGIDGYKNVICNSHSRFTGGVLIYIKKGIRSQVVEILNLSNVWCIKMCIWMNDEKWTVAVFYRSPSSSTIDFLTFFSNWCLCSIKDKDNILVMGDFNIDLLTKNRYAEKMLEILTDQGLCQIVNQPTRITEHSATLIDYVITNKDLKSRVKYVIDARDKITDHETISIDVQIQKKPEIKRKEYSVLRYTKEHFDSCLITEGFHNIFSKDDLNDLSNSFSEKLNKCCEKLTVKKLAPQFEGKKWFNFDLLRLKNEKIRAYNIASLNKTSDNWLRYKNIRNKYKKEIRMAKSDYIISKISATEGNQIEMWKTLKNIVLKNTKQNSIESIHFGDVISNQSGEIANKFNNYFIDSICEINASIPYIPFVSPDISVNSVFSFSFCSERSLYTLISKLNNKKDMFRLNKEMILQSIEIIGPVLMKIINTSLSTGKFPESWKESLIVPVEKVSNSNKCEDFRPVNMLPLCEKILEKFVAEQFLNYLECNSLLIEEQSGFRNGHSCETAINCVVWNWKRKMDGGLSIVAVFLDLKRAFETIDREILLKKLRLYGVCDREWKWFESYLSNRSQRARVNGETSSARVNNLGVPQGSVLGVFLFLLYINDFKKCLKYCSMKLFADDSLIYICGKNSEDMCAKLNEDLKRLDIWLKMNKLKVNVNKTKYMKFGMNDNIDVRMDNEPLVCVESIKYLGCVIDKKLNLKEHANHICAKISKKVYFFSRIRKNLTLNASTVLYNAIILPHFNYCSTLLFGSNADVKQRLQRLQNKSMRIILRLNVYTPIRVLLECLCWMNVKQKLMFDAMIFIFKLRNDMLPEYLSDGLVEVAAVQPYSLRNGTNLRPERCRLSSTQSSIFYDGINYFNNLPNSVKSETNMNAFKKKLCEFIKIDIT